jgi:hypothetical protein
MPHAVHSEWMATGSCCRTNSRKPHRVPSVRVNQEERHNERCLNLNRTSYVYLNVGAHLYLNRLYSQLFYDLLCYNIGPVAPMSLHCDHRSSGTPLVFRIGPSRTKGK